MPTIGEKDDRPALSVVIPCYNEQDNIPELVRRVGAVCAEKFGSDYEILLVDDGSRDQTWPRIVAASASNGCIVGIKLSRNYGHQIALTAGLRQCTGDRILVLDADLQDPPELLPDMLAKMDEGHDVVYGQRAARHGETWFKKLTAAIFYRGLGTIIDVDIPRDTGDFRLMSRRVLDELNAMPERFRFIRGMVSWLGYPQTAIRYERDPRFAGASHYPLHKMISFALDAVTSFSTKPLRFASHLGMVFGLMGIVALFWVGWSYLAAGTVPGWTSLAALVLVMGSVQLFVLGVIGEYLGRMYIETKQRPLFLIEDVSRRVVAQKPIHEQFEELQRAFKA